LFLKSKALLQKHQHQITHDAWHDEKNNSFRPIFVVRFEQASEYHFGSADCAGFLAEAVAPAAEGGVGETDHRLQTMF
jgi:hypothetical protein